MMRSLNLIGEDKLFVIRIDIHCTIIMCLHCGASMSYLAMYSIVSACFFELLNSLLVILWYLKPQ